MEDRELIRRIQDGQKQYLNEIAEKYYNDIYYFCCYQTGSREDAYDLAQETFLRFIRYVDRYQYRNLKGYILTIAMNLCRNYACGSGKAPVLSESFESEQGGRGEEEAQVSCGREYEEREKALKDYNTQMGSAERRGIKKGIHLAKQVLSLHVLGKSEQEIAAECGCTVEEVREILE